MKWEDVNKIIKLIIKNGQSYDYLDLDDNYLIEKETDKLHGWFMKENLTEKIAQQQISGSADATPKSCYNCKKGCGIAEYKDCVNNNYRDWISRTSDI